jgi:hypothetical protein
MEAVQETGNLIASDKVQGTGPGLIGLCNRSVSQPRLGGVFFLL